ncbi:MAG: hypothetical protein J6Y90_05465, partial [Lachnospiraceae bacterium]|nr:hypothetical protein [Lachnospiraceae bacterium]
MSEKMSQAKRIGGISAAKETGKMRRSRGKTLLISAITAVLITAATLSPILLSGCSNRKNSSDSQTVETGGNPDSPLMTSDNSAGLSERTSSVSQTAETGGNPNSPLQTSDSSAGLSGETDSGKEDMSSTIAAAVEEAKLYAASYDYDKATARLEPLKEKDGSGEVGRLLAELSSLKGTLEEADITAIPHIFFHSLIVDPSLAFHNNKARADDYNTAMTTVDEFNRIIQQMYDRDYVLVSLHQMAQYTEETDGSGAMKAGKIMLPPGKKPIVLSIDDMSYYAYMMKDGFATKLVIGSDGSLTNEMVKNDGTVVYGSFDVVPLLDDFIKMHPDFSYQGAKGVIALTGYDGVFGYRTDQDYYLKEHLLYEQAEWLKKHPDFDYEK